MHKMKVISVILSYGDILKNIPLWEILDQDGLDQDVIILRKVKKIEKKIQYIDYSID